MTEATITAEDVQSPNPNIKIKIVHISGQLDESNVDQKIQEIYKIVEENPQNLRLIFELENLEYMNSKSIGYLTDIYGKITEKGGKAAIAMARPNIIDILQVVGLTQLIETFDSLEKAKTAMLELPAEEQPTPTQETPAQPATTVPPVPEQPTPATPSAPTPSAPEPQPTQPATPPPAPQATTPEPEPAPTTTPSAAPPETTPTTPPTQPAPPTTTPQNPAGEEGTYSLGQ